MGPVGDNCSGVQIPAQCPLLRLDRSDSGYSPHEVHPSSWCWGWIPCFNWRQLWCRKNCYCEGILHFVFASRSDDFWANTDMLIKGSDKCVSRTIWTMLEKVLSLQQSHSVLRLLQELFSAFLKKSLKNFERTCWDHLRARYRVESC